MRNPNCSNCGLGDFVRSTGGSVCIWGEESHAESNFQCDVLVVGQNPGAAENRAGRPFVGESGRLLRPLLDETGLRYVITNAAKCHAEGNRTPTTVELNGCRPFLLDEIRKYNPRAIFAVGNSALQTLTGASGVTKQRGIPQKLRKEFALDIPVLCSIHPALVLRYPAERTILEQDISGLRRFVLGLGIASSVEFTLEERLSDISLEGEFTFDIESTTAKYTSDIFNIHCIGVKPTGQSHVTILRDESDFQQFAKRVGPSTTFNGLGFDVPSLTFRDLDPPKGLADHKDAMLLAYLTDEAMPYHNLQACAIRWLGAAPWKDEGHEFVDKASGIWRKPENDAEWQQMGRYNARDVYYTEQLAKILWDDLDEKRRAVYKHILVPATQDLGAIFRNGFLVSLENLGLARDEAEGEIERTLRIIQRIAEENWILDLNPNSAKQLRGLLFHTLGLKPIKYTPGGDASTDSETLKILAQDEKAEEVCRALLTYKGATKLKTSYIDRYTRLLRDEPDNRLHPSYSLISTETGRTSSWAQQMPRKKSVRRMVVSAPGNSLLVADQSQIELRTMAWRSREPTMLAVYRDGLLGGDIHSLIGLRLVNMRRAIDGLTPYDYFDKEAYSAERTLSKGVNFGCVYGAEAPTLQAYLFAQFGLKVTFKEALFLRNDVFFGTFNKLTDYYDSIIDEVKRTKISVSSFGRVRHLGNISAGSLQERSEAARQMLNTGNQADASDITLIGLNLARQTLRKEIKPIMFVHDSNSFEGPEAWMEEAEAIVVDCMTTKTIKYIEDHFNFTIDVPLIVDTKISKEWV